MTILTNGLIAAAGAITFIAGTVGIATAQTVIPNSLENQEGSGNNGLPFNLSGFSIGSMRYQQVYSASGFSSLSQPSLITEILFRPDGEFRDGEDVGQAFSSSLTDIQINLSTTTAMPDALSTTFADNVGTDDTVVFGRGSMSLSSLNTRSDEGPKDFDISIALETPFLYDPTMGNLLLDIRNFGGGTTTQFDSQNEVGDSTSRVLSLGYDSVNNTSGISDSTGLVTKFVFDSPPIQSVPETTGVLSFLVVAGGIVATSFRQR